MQVRRSTVRILIGSLATTTVLAVGASLSASAGQGNGAETVNARGELIRYALPDGAPNPILEGATARVQAVATPSGKTIVKLHVDGLAPNRAFGSHVHTRACGATGAAAGPHYQNVPSVNPEFANPQNEVWLDFTTNASGNAVATVTVDWHFVQDLDHPDGANSVIIHRDPTSTGLPGQPAPGVAGPRIGCLTVPFTS